MASRLTNIRKNLQHLKKRWIEPVISVTRLYRATYYYARYLSDWYRYSSLPGSERNRFSDSYPCLFDSLDTTPYDPHYFYQAVWVMERIVRSGRKWHMDIGSDIQFVGMLTTYLPVTFVDIRPIKAKYPRLPALAPIF